MDIMLRIGLQVIQLILSILSKMSDFNFTGKVVLVTGSSRGIGAEMIKAFGTRGAECVVNYVADPHLLLHKKQPLFCAMVGGS